jgi:hypothetical protein
MKRAVEMSRVERFKEIRDRRRKYILSVSFVLIIMILGICTVDYSVNTILLDEKRLSLVTYQTLGEDELQISILNNKIPVNTTFIKRDFQRLKNILWQP